MFLLWLINIAVRRDNAHIQFIDSNPDPEPVPVNPIPDCASDMFARLPCWDFFYTPNNSAAVDVRWVVSDGGGVGWCLGLRSWREDGLPGRLLVRSSNNTGCLTINAIHSHITLPSRAS